MFNRLKGNISRKSRLKKFAENITLYHGTTSKYLEQIVSQGVVPGSESGNTSHPHEEGDYQIMALPNQVFPEEYDKEDMEVNLFEMIESEGFYLLQVFGDTYLARGYFEIDGEEYEQLLLTHELSIYLRDKTIETAFSIPKIKQYIEENNIELDAKVYHVTDGVMAFAKENNDNELLEAYNLLTEKLSDVYIPVQLIDYEIDSAQSVVYLGDYDRAFEYTKRDISQINRDGEFGIVVEVNVDTANLLPDIDDGIVRLDFTSETPLWKQTYDSLQQVSYDGTIPLGSISSITFSNIDIGGDPSLESEFLTFDVPLTIDEALQQYRTYKDNVNK